MHGTGRVQVIELGLAISCYELRRLLGNSWRPDYVQFRHAAPDVMAPLQRVFGENLHFNQDVNAIHLRPEDYNHQLRSVPDVDRKVFQRELETSVGHGMPFALRVDRIIRLLINDAGCSVETVADALNTNSRTLQYRLKQNQTSYQALYDIARIDLAKHYLSNSDLSIAAITERLHFTDAATFSRFFKKQTGHSPRKYSKHKRLSNPTQPT